MSAYLKQMGEHHALKVLEKYRGDPVPKPKFACCELTLSKWNNYLRPFIDLWLWLCRGINRDVRIWSSLGLNIWTFRAAFMPYSGSRLVFPWRVNRLAVLAPGTLLFPMQTFGLRWGFLTVHVLLCTRNPHFINYSNPFYIYKTRLKRPYQHVSTCFSGIFFWGTWWPACLFLKL